MKKLIPNTEFYNNSIATAQNIFDIHGKITLQLYNAIRNNETTYSRQQLSTLYGITFNDLKKLASIETFTYNNKFSNLLINSKEAYYWAGFIFADGSINKDYSCFNMRLAKQDADHVKAFREFVEYSGKQKSLDISLSHKDIKTFSDKFGIVPDKSHNCLDYNFYKNLPYDLWISWLIGYTDGDGSITSRKDRPGLVTIRYVAHQSNASFHEELLKDIKYRIDDCNSTIKYKEETIIRWYISKRSICKELATKAKELPSLRRKWDKVVFV